MASRPRRLTPSKPLPDTGIEALLHGACVRAGAGASMQVVLDRLPLLRPLLPAGLRFVGSRESAQATQRAVVEEIYRRYGLKPAAWEVEGVLAVAQTQAVLSPLASREGLRSLLRGWLPDALSGPLMRYTPLEPLVTATVHAVAETWAAGRYADSVCRLRKAGADWLPKPLASALNMAPATLKAWSAEALSMAMPPLKLATTLGRQLTSLALPRTAVSAGVRKPANKKAPAKKRAPASKSAGSRHKAGSKPRAQKTTKSARQPRSTQTPSRRKPQE
ncbi:hypothetical protein [Arenimonas donghaensis]|uniref:Uncharacterized protein n=1 Tax=Arenimonas donghaensis DSM 18148 = HO3-R19 TaxID=1121014 RepID=A0A087MML1_9GAMM|nr:hypothetical protein [Arenimonas donghaensis]KFL38114.1 hypothetical protein N788_02745 [Arenimonas donghaensis DSM 18148 = HO3-R19]